MESTVPWRAAPATATPTASARPITTWSGSVGASLDGSGPDVISTWNKIAQIEKTTTKVTSQPIFSHLILQRFFKQKLATPGLFSLFRLFNTVDSKQYSIKTLPMSGFEPGTSGVGSDRFAN